MRHAVCSVEKSGYVWDSDNTVILAIQLLVYEVLLIYYLGPIGVLLSLNLPFFVIVENAIAWGCSDSDVAREPDNKGFRRTQ